VVWLTVFWLGDLVLALAERKPALAVSVVLLAGGATYWLYRATAHMKRRWWLGWCVFVLVVNGNSVITGIKCRTEGYVYEYCAYGAVSQAQFNSCRSHVDHHVIDGLDTNAARFAKGQRTSCGGDAGPFCPDALTRRDLLEDAPRPYE
jgi:hypothetical protein